MILIITTLIGSWLRFFQLGTRMMFIGDQAWFYLSARDALLAGHIPLLGITSSITWLHQGPLFTYLLVPALFFSNYHPVSGAILTSALGVAAIPLAYYLGAKLWSKSMGIVLAWVLAVLPFAVIHSRFAYHTSPLVLFEIITLLLFTKRSLFLGFLFLGFLYQLHLLTFIFWPVIFVYLVKNKIKFKIYHLWAFLLGILPMLIAGPIQLFGIFAWLAKNLLSGFPAQTGISEAYRVVLLVPILLFACMVMSKAYLKVIVIGCLLFGLWAFSHQQWGYGHYFSRRMNLARQILSNSSLSNPEIIIEGPGAEFEASKLPYIYLLWWLERQGQMPQGNYIKFVVNDSAQTVKMLE
jgi:hypothetical protein